MPVLAMLLKKLSISLAIGRNTLLDKKREKRMGQFSLKGQKKGAEIAVISDKRTYEQPVKVN